MTVINGSNRSPGAWPSPSVMNGRVVTPRVSELDPQLKARVEGNSVVIRGMASNSGSVPSVLNLKFDKHLLSIPLRKGMTAFEVREEVRKQLPKGYELRTTPEFMPMRPNTRYASFQIVAVAPKQNGTQPIYKAFNAAMRPGTTAGDLISRRELREIVADARRDGFTAKEKKAVAASWAATFNGADHQATAAAQKLYAKLAERHDLPTTYYVR